MSSSLVSRVGYWALCAGFPVLAVRCGRRSRGLRAGRRFRVLRWVALAKWPLVGGRLCDLAFRAASR
jgi:hypothetical protein